MTVLMAGMCRPRAATSVATSTASSPDEKRSINLDFDWVYRRALDGTARWGHAMFGRLWASIGNVLAAARTRIGGRLFQAFSPMGAISRDIPSGMLAIWTSALLAIVLIIMDWARAT